LESLMVTHVGDLGDIGNFEVQCALGSKAACHLYSIRCHGRLLPVYSRVCVCVFVGLLPGV
jgi:hypothetical protein